MMANTVGCGAEVSPRTEEPEGAANEQEWAPHLTVGQSGGRTGGRAGVAVSAAG